MRRLHLRVGPAAFLPAQLALADDGGWFGAAELDELLALLHDELPRRLPEALRAQAPTPPVVCRGDTVQACLDATDGGEVLFAAAQPGYTAVACTLLLHADRYDPKGRGCRCPGAATLAAAPATAVMEESSRRPCTGQRRLSGGRRRRRRWRVDVLGLHARERGAGVALRGVCAAASWRRGGAAKTGRPAAGARAARRVVGR